METLLQRHTVKNYQFGIEKRIRRFRHGTYVRQAIAARYGDLLHDEDCFRAMLVMERKRTERSNNPFMIMFIDVSGLQHMNTSLRTVKNLISTISTITRETDIKGWYSSQRIIGIIFTEYDPMSIGTIVQKVKDSFNKVLTSAQISVLELSYYLFPGDKEHGGNRVADINAVLYSSEMSVARVKKLSLFYKRYVDIVGSLSGLIVFLPLFLIIPVIIKMTSKGAVFFKQERVGQYGKKFTLLKFRTMKESNDNAIHKNFIKQFIKDSHNVAGDNSEQQFKIQNDPRITWIGNFLRKTSLDEVPQFINVLCGEMSLVGPRPAIPYEVDEYDVWHKRRVLEVKPGITGFWQVKGRSRTDFNTMVRMDVQYIQNWSLKTDFQIILQTPLALLSVKGAY